MEMGGINWGNHAKEKYRNNGKLWEIKEKIQYFLQRLASWKSDRYKRFLGGRMSMKFREAKIQ